jgi:ABC-2 type transport system permease protein
MRIACVALLGEVRKGLLVGWTYRMNSLTGLLTLGFIFLAVVFFLGGGVLNPEQMASSLLGYLTWMYAALAISDLSYGLRGEMNAGTLEQMSMSPAPVGLILLGRVLANLLVTTAQVLLMGAVMSLILGIHIPLRWAGLPVLFLTLFGILGFGFVVAGAVLVFKQVESFANLIQNGLAFLNGSFLPIEAMPAWMAGFARVLPSTQGIVVLRQVVLHGQSLASVWRDGSLPWLIAHSAIWFAAGWLAFSVGERIAKEQGSLGQY